MEAFSAIARLVEAEAMAAFAHSLAVSLIHSASPPTPPGLLALALKSIGLVVVVAAAAGCIRPSDPVRQVWVSNTSPSDYVIRIDEGIAITYLVGGATRGLVSTVVGQDTDGAQLEVLDSACQIVFFERYVDSGGIVISATGQIDFVIEPFPTDGPPLVQGYDRVPSCRVAFRAHQPAVSSR